MQRMRPNIPPKAIQPDLRPRRPTPRHLKHAARHTQARIRGDHLHARHQLRELAPLARVQLPPVVAVGVVVGGVELGGERAGAVGQRVGGGQVRVEVAVALEHVELLERRVLVVAAVRPGARVLARVGGGEVDGTLGDAEVEVGEDELDSVEVLV